MDVLTQNRAFCDFAEYHGANASAICPIAQPMSMGSGHLVLALQGSSVGDVSHPLPKEDKSHKSQAKLGERDFCGSEWRVPDYSGDKRRLQRDFHEFRRGRRQRVLVRLPGGG